MVSRALAGPRHSGAIPYVGSLIDAFMFGKAQSIGETRLDRFLDQLQKDLDIIEETAVNREYVQSEEFLDLVILALEAALRTRSEDES